MRLLPFLLLFSACFGAVSLGVDALFEDKQIDRYIKKRVALVTNHTGVDSKLTSTIDRFQERLTLVALFAPEHGISGSHYANENVASQRAKLPIYSLHGATRRPTKKMLENVDVIFYDIQDIGVRSYTYATTLYYVMEEAARYKIPVVVLDRPNPLGGLTVDGPMLRDKFRSFLGYIDIPYCHGMTIGELATYFNAEYKVGCSLSVIKMKGWHRNMTFADTGLSWVPTSPHIPEPDTPYFYASTGILGELGIVNIGVGYTLPFKVVGAPWIDAKKFASALNSQNLPGVHFTPFTFRPFFGSCKGKECSGVLINITNPTTYRPLSVQYLLIGILKSLYPKQVASALSKISKTSRDLFNKANGNGTVMHYLQNETYIAWPLIALDENLRKQFLSKRKQYLLYD